MLVRSDGFVRKYKSVRSKCPKRKTAPAPIVKKHLLYEIQKVVDARNGVHGREYFVKWRGYPSCENMWIGDLPPFFHKSPFYTTKGRDAIVESESGSDTDSEEDDTVDSDEEEEEVIDSDSEDDEDVVEVSDDESPPPSPTLKRRRVDKKVSSSKKAKNDTNKCKCPPQNVRKFLLSDDDDDDDEVGSSKGSVVPQVAPTAVIQGTVVKPDVVEQPEVVIRLKASSRDKAKASKKEQLAMCALLALANYVNDTESDSE
jgi:hypothetical protein